MTSIQEHLQEAESLIQADDDGLVDIGKAQIAMAIAQVVQARLLQKWFQGEFNDAALTLDEIKAICAEEGVFTDWPEGITAETMLRKAINESWRDGYRNGQYAGRAFLLKTPEREWNDLPA